MIDEDTSTPNARPKRVAFSLRAGLAKAGKSVSSRLGALLYAVSFALIGLSGWAAFSNILQTGWSSEAAGWVQAAGSIAAIAGATWLAQGEAKRARRARREQGEELAWYVRFSINQAQHETHIIAYELTHRDEPVVPSDVRDWLQRADTSSASLGFLAARTDFLHPAIAHAIANAKVLMDYVVQDLKELQKEVELDNSIDEKLKNRIVGAHFGLAELVQVFDSRMAGVIQALDRGGDALPRDGWANWRQQAR